MSTAPITVQTTTNSSSAQNGGSGAISGMTECC